MELCYVIRLFQIQDDSDLRQDRHYPQLFEACAICTVCQLSECESDKGASEVSPTLGSRMRGHYII